MVSSTVIFCVREQDRSQADVTCQEGTVRDAEHLLSRWRPLGLFHHGTHEQ
jgi:hypothetical protein